MARIWPAEWHPQSAVLLTWPHQYSDWAPMLAQIEPVFIDIVSAIARHEAVIICCYDTPHGQTVRCKLESANIDMAAIHFVICQSNDTWTRDFGPLTVYENGHPLLFDFTFNGWGNKDPWHLDNAITQCLSSTELLQHLPVMQLGWVLEGGSIESDGQGTLLTTSRCLLNPSRNPQHDKTSIENHLKDCLGVTNFHWLEHGWLEGDDTDGHIDMLARFAAVDTIIYQGCDEPTYPAFESLQAMEKELMALKTLEGQTYHLYKLPWPSAHFDAAGKRLPASYANFLIINQAVLLPVYDDPADNEAINLLTKVFPERRIIPIDCSRIIEQHGSLHCLTMQLPAEAVNPNTGNPI
ncbi:MAG: agmatine deiminase family protein [Gammaproteobacteria bacterium]